jgi:hypothetical protein
MPDVLPVVQTVFRDGIEQTVLPALFVARQKLTLGEKLAGRRAATTIQCL